MAEKEYRQHRFQRPPGDTEILLVRHGESRPARPDDPFPLLDGHGDPELAMAGREQALRIGERLRHLPIDAVYVTKLRRTQETAAPLCGHLGIKPIIEPNLHEVNLDEWEGGIFRIKAAQKDPIIIRLQKEQRWDVIPGAEPNDVFHERIQRGLNKIAADHPDQLVVAVVHGGVIGQSLPMRPVPDPSPLMVLTMVPSAILSYMRALFWYAGSMTLHIWMKQCWKALRRPLEVSGQPIHWPEKRPVRSRKKTYRNSNTVEFNLTPTFRLHSASYDPTSR